MWLSIVGPAEIEQTGWELEVASRTARSPWVHEMIAHIARRDIHRATRAAGRQCSHVLVFADACPETSPLERRFDLISWCIDLMTFQDLVSWLTTSVSDAGANLAVFAGLLLTGASLLRCFFDRRQKRESLPQVPAI